MRMGAYDYITKPIDTNRLHTILQNASALLGTRAESKSRAGSYGDAGFAGQPDRIVKEDAGDLSPH